MTADERIETLLNRAGQTISDLPKPTESTYAHTLDNRMTVKKAVHQWFGEDDDTYILSKYEFSDYILHLADVIDRMEAALENTLLELEELKNKHNTRDFVSHYRLRHISTPMH